LRSGAPGGHAGRDVLWPVSGTQAVVTTATIVVVAAAQTRPVVTVASEVADVDRRLRWLERQRQWEWFVGNLAGPTVAVNRACRRDQTEAHRRTDEVWRTRALGKRPQRRASG